MEDDQFRGMSTDQLYELHALVGRVLAQRLTEEKNRLEERLRAVHAHQAPKYAQVQYRNPDKPSQTWTGHGRRPRWITEQLNSGKRLEDLKTGIAARKSLGNR